MCITLTVELKTCGDCHFPRVLNSLVCTHDDIIHQKYDERRKLNIKTLKIPEWCPLRTGSSYLQ